MILISYLKISSNKVIGMNKLENILLILHIIRIKIQREK